MSCDTLKRIMAVAPVAINGRTYSDGSKDCEKIIEPKMITMMTGVSSIILASGARTSPRKHASAMADACSDSQGNVFSRNVGLGDTCLATTSSRSILGDGTG